MKRKNYLWTLYLISVVILISIITQVYFNYTNYQKNKQQYINDVQISLDNAMDAYFTVLAKKEFKVISQGSGQNVYLKNNVLSTKKFTELKINNDTIHIIELSNKHFPHKKKITIKPIQENKKISFDSLITQELSTLFMSITEEKIKLKKLKKLLDIELKRKKIEINYQLNSFINDNLDSSIKNLTPFKKPIKTYAKSTYLSDNEKLELVFSNQSLVYLKRGLVGILLSLLFSLAIIASLFYLLNIIKKQKAIAEIKNDFISNITHEFKTPITTIGLALEGIKQFTKGTKNKKTTEYLNISHSQLDKLNLMVEKVLETSFLDSENLLLKKEPYNLVILLENQIQKQPSNPKKEILFKTNTSVALLQIDVFHFENAINNLIENALKYGGNKIIVTLEKNENNIAITLFDSGSIPKAQHQKIFDKFYRIPQGNQHDVKGFGIGLYYTKKIIEKHFGTITLLNTKNTTFKINLPYEN
jgi:two-component system phosphate regulon sensor histidine kinase PhoR